MMRRPVSHSLVKTLRAVRVFSTLDDRTLLKIVGASANLFWKAGSVIFERGAPAEGLYLVVSGRVGLYSSADGERSERQVGPGAYIGESALMLQTIHANTAQAVEDSELLVIPTDSFEELLDTNPDLAEHFRLAVEGQRSPQDGDSGA